VLSLSFQADAVGLAILFVCDIWDRLAPRTSGTMEILFCTGPLALPSRGFWPMDANSCLPQTTLHPQAASKKMWCTAGEHIPR
jgi:hypothetical protein